MAVLTGRGHSCDLSGATWGRCRRSDWTVPLNRDRTYRRRCFIQVNNRTGDSEFAIVFLVFFTCKKLLGGTETRTRDRKCFQSIRTVRDISRDDRARKSTCSLLSSTDRLNENYSIDLPCSFTPTEEGEPGVYISSSPLTPDNCYFEVVILDPGETGYTSELGRNVCYEGALHGTTLNTNQV